MYLQATLRVRHVTIEVRETKYCCRTAYIQTNKLILQQTCTSAVHLLPVHAMLSRYVSRRYLVVPAAAQPNARIHPTVGSRYVHSYGGVHTYGYVVLNMLPPFLLRRSFL